MESKRVLLRRYASRNVNEYGAVTSYRNGKDHCTIAYTKDKVPVYNVIVQKLPKKVKRSLILKHFSKFGEIKDVQIMYGKSRSIPAQCVIQYLDTNGAGTALRQRVHTLEYERLVVKACPSWEQPFEIDGISPNCNVTTILSLNDYCLEIIYQKLDLQHQIRLSLYHPRLEQVFASMICPRLPRQLKLRQLEKFSTWELRQFFRTSGEYLQSLEVGSGFPNHNALVTICNFIRENCLHVTRLKVMFRTYFYGIFLNALNTDNIIELELYQCDMYDSDLKHLRQLPNLQSLGLACNHNMRGEHLQYLRKVQCLSLYSCESILYDALIACCRTLKLRYLDVRLTDHSRYLSSAIDYYSELETLKISLIHEVRWMNIMKLPKLKYLELHLLLTAMPANCYQLLADYHADDLLELKITGQTYAILPTVAVSIARLKKLRVLWLGENKFNVSKEMIKLLCNLSELEEINLHYSKRLRDEHLIPLLAKLTKLKRLNLCHCRHISAQFIWRAIEILEKRETTNCTQPLAVLVCGTRIQKDTLECMHYKKNRNLVKLLFHAETSPMGLIAEESVYDICDWCNHDEEMELYSDGNDDEDSSDEEPYNIYDIFFMI